MAVELLLHHGTPTHMPVFGTPSLPPPPPLPRFSLHEPLDQSGRRPPRISAYLHRSTPIYTDLRVSPRISTDIELNQSDAKISADLREVLGLINATEANATDEEAVAAATAAAAAAVAAGDAGGGNGEDKRWTRVGTEALLMDSAVEWRRQKVVQDATFAAQRLLCAYHPTCPPTILHARLPSYMPAYHPTCPPT